MADRASLIEEAKSIPWFHSINFGDYISPARVSGANVANGTLQPIWEFLQHIDVKGLDCLDIGAADGVVAFTLKQMGARRVVASDGSRRRQFEIARDLLALDVEYAPDVHDIDLARKLEPNSFDVIVMAGFLYHLLSPLTAITACRKLLRPGGLLLTETCYTGGEAPSATLNTEIDPPFTEQWSTYWIATPSCIEGMLKLSSFDVLGSASLGKKLTNGGIGRIGHVARAVSPDDVKDRKPQLVSTHSKLKGVPELDFIGLRKSGSPTSVEYKGPRDHIDVPGTRYPEWVPLLPRVGAA